MQNNEVTSQLLTEDTLNNLVLFSDVVTNDIKNIEDFRNFIRQTIRPLLPHGKLFCGYGDIVADQINVRYVVDVDYPAEDAAKIGLHFHIPERPMLAQWLMTQHPVFVHKTRDWHLLSTLEKQEIDDFDLGNLALHGHIDLNGKMATYFSFAQVNDQPDLYIKRLRVLMPYLHTALIRLDEHAKVAQKVDFTEKEKEVIYWLILGKQNSEIASILGKSINTVRNQIQHIFIKLGVSNRQAALMRIQALQLM
jgi:DNA-binding CsgD family transcriptional regulator